MITNGFATTVLFACIFPSFIARAIEFFIFSLLLFVASLKDAFRAFNTSFAFEDVTLTEIAVSVAVFDGSFT